jgi:integrase
MGRRRKHNRNLPPRLRRQHGAYYYTPWVNGKQKWIRLSDNYGEALAKWAKIEGQEGENNGLVSGMIDKFIQTKITEYSKKAQEDYLRYCGVLRAVFGDTAMDEVKPHHLTTFLRKSTHKIQANRQISLLSRIYSVAINEWGWLHINPCREVHRNKEARRDRYITDLELSALTTAASDQMICIIDLAYLTAARKSDLLKIMLKDIRPDGLHIRQQKTGKYQIFNWSPALQAVVARAKELRRRHDSMYLFCTRTGAPHSTSGFNSMWRRVKAKADLPDLHFHDLRAKAVTDAKRAHGRDFAQALAGHSSGDMTDAYVRDNPNVEPLR